MDEGQRKSEEEVGGAGARHSLAGHLSDLDGQMAGQETGMVTQQNLIKPNEEDDRGPQAGGVGPGEPASTVGSRPSPRPSRGPASLGPNPSLVASLKELAEHSDHSLLAQSLHQIAEAFFLEGDYERAVQLIQLERLYHQRLLTNLTSLQEQWERRIEAGRSPGDFPSALEHLETLRHICRTHLRPTLSAPKRMTAQTQSDGDDQGATPLSRRAACDLQATKSRPGQLTMETEVSPAAASSPTEEPHLIGPTCTQFDTPTRGGRATPAGVGGDEEIMCSTKENLATPNHSPEAGSRADATGEERTTRGHYGPSGVGKEATITSNKKPAGWRASCVFTETNLPVPKDQESWEEEEEEEEEEETEAQAEEEEFEDDGEDLEETLECEQDDRTLEAETGPDSLHTLAELIQVEEVTPVDGLVSILKRKASQDGGISQTATKRRVRFREPNDGFDQDEVGGASCLVLFILCLVTVVLSMGGTALYCTFADETSSVCTDFSHNVEFYIGHMRRGLNELKRWLSPGS